MSVLAGGGSGALNWLEEVATSMDMSEDWCCSPPPVASAHSPVPTAHRPVPIAQCPDPTAQHTAHSPVLSAQHSAPSSELPTRSCACSLFMDIQTPDIQAKLPVVLYIHGGSYLSGAGDGNNASVLCDDGASFFSICHTQCRYWLFHMLPAYRSRCLVTADIGLSSARLVFCIVYFDALDIGC